MRHLLKQYIIYKDEEQIQFGKVKTYQMIT